MAAVLVFALSYLAISGGSLPGLAIDRPAAALAGAVAMVLVGALDPHAAYAAINLDTLVLLFGMLTLSASLGEAGFFRWLASVTLTHARTPRRLLWLLVVVAGTLSAVLVNDTICVMLTPVVVLLVEEGGLAPLPFLLALSSASNVGGVVTLTGNPQNMLVGTASGIAFGGFFLRMLPIGALGLVLDAAVLTLLFRGGLRQADGPAPVAHAAARDGRLDRRTTWLALGALALVLAGFFAGHSLAGTAVLGAAIVLAFGGRRARRALRAVDFPLLVFFAGLFVIVAGLQRGGGLDHVLDHLAGHLGGGPMRQAGAFAVITVLGSNLISNVPFVLVGARLVPRLADPKLGWLVLAMASTLAGNLTIFGSVANLIVLESAGRYGRIGFWRFLRAGAVITLVTLALGLGVLWIERGMGWL